MDIISITCCVSVMSLLNVNSISKVLNLYTFLRAMLAQSAVMRLHFVRPSVRPSVTGPEIIFEEFKPI